MLGPSLHVCQYKHTMRIHGRGGGGAGPSEIYVVHAWTQKQNHNENTKKRWCWNLPRSMWYTPGPKNKTTVRAHGRGWGGILQGLSGTCLDPETKSQWGHQEKMILKKKKHSESTWKRLGWNPPRSKWYMPGPRNKITMRTPGKDDVKKTKPQWEHMEEAGVDRVEISKV